MNDTKRLLTPINWINQNPITLNADLIVDNDKRDLVGFEQENGMG